MTTWLTLVTDVLLCCVGVADWVGRKCKKAAKPPPMISTIKKLAMVLVRAGRECRFRRCRCDGGTSLLSTCKKLAMFLIRAGRECRFRCCRCDGGTSLSTCKKLAIVLIRAGRECRFRRCRCDGGTGPLFTCVCNGGVYLPTAG